MDPTGTDDTHQLLGTPSSRAGSVDLSQETLWSFGVTAAGQFHCNSLHQQPGRDCHQPLPP